VGRSALVARFAVQLVWPKLAWDLLADLEPILRGAKEPQSYAVEVLDPTGSFEATDVPSARAQSAERAQPAHRITLTVKGYAGPGDTGQRDREYSVSVWASGLDKVAGAAMNGHAEANGAEAESYADELLDEAKEQTRAFLKNHYVLLEDQDQPNPPPADDATPSIATRNRRGLLWYLSNQPLVAQIIGGTVAAVLAAAIIAGLTWLISR
jgi:hypothetical protein